MIALSRKSLRLYRGHSLTELLVVLAIIGLLLALLLPAVQRVRESANRLRCAQHLAQIGLAFHTAHQDYGVFPTGGAGFYRTWLSGQPAGPIDQDWSWAYQILPYLEQGALHATPGGPLICYDTTHPLPTTPIPVYFCPSRRRPGLKNDGRAGIDYFANGGVNGPFVPPGQSDSYTAPPWGDWTASGAVIRCGPAYLPAWRERRSVSLENGLPDGTSSTLLISEKSFHAGRVGQSANWYDNESYVGAWHNNHWPDTVGTAALAPAQDTHTDPPTADYPDGSKLYRFGSAHPGSMNAVFADGSLRPIRYSVPLAVFQSLAVRDDGAIVGTYWRD